MGNVCMKSIHIGDDVSNHIYEIILIDFSHTDSKLCLECIEYIFNRSIGGAVFWSENQSLSIGHDCLLNENAMMRRQVIHQNCSRPDIGLWINVPNNMLNKVHIIFSCCTCLLLNPAPSFSCSCNDKSDCPLNTLNVPSLPL